MVAITVTVFLEEDKRRPWQFGGSGGWVSRHFTGFYSWPYSQTVPTK